MEIKICCCCFFFTGSPRFCSYDAARSEHRVFSVSHGKRKREREKEILCRSHRVQLGPTVNFLMASRPHLSRLGRTLSFYRVFLPGFHFFCPRELSLGLGITASYPPLLLSYYWIPLADRAGAVGFILFFVCVCVCVCYFTSRADAISAPGHRLDRGGARRFAVRFTAVAFSAWCAPLASID